MILYSVIVPAYNAESTIGKCLDALERQNIPRDEYEVIVVDDGSTDNMPGIVKRFPVKYISQQNKGPASARNRGAGEAKGEIILFTDSDCVPRERSEERRVGKECRRLCRSRWSPYH
jgi:glycosyltransferase involved in cell wall biosynthesis